MIGFAKSKSDTKIDMMILFIVNVLLIIHLCVYNRTYSVTSVICFQMKKRGRLEMTFLGEHVYVCVRMCMEN